MSDGDELRRFYQAISDLKARHPEWFAKEKEPKKVVDGKMAASGEDQDDRND